MELRWNLDKIYSCFEAEEFTKDVEKFDKFIEDFSDLADNKQKLSCEKFLETYVIEGEKFANIAHKLFAYCQLALSVDSKNQVALKNLEILQEKSTALAESEAKIEKWIGSLENLDEIINGSQILKEFKFYLVEKASKAKYILSEKEEVIIAKMQNTGSNAWSKLRDLATANLTVDIKIDGIQTKLPLTVVRNMAYDKDGEKRRKAYEAELKAYEKIEDTLAACLNGIKGEVITICKLKGYSSVMEKTLIDSRMDEETLNTMIQAIQESLPSFRKYYKAKAQLLGHENGLPFYDLFAPIGEVNMKFTYEEAKKFIVENFNSFSKELGAYAKKAFEENWIDAEPRKGKVGGAFCFNIHAIGESRILSNFSGNFNDVITLAHELGHGYHGECLKNERALNSNYPMPIAETASTFCETIVKKAALKTAKNKEALVILERSIADSGQVIVDILSRYLFETDLFKLREEGSLSADQLKESMIKAQKEAYGDGLDENHLHPYMWLNKPHYYDADTNFYNFPYAFGLLFAKGLYAVYLEKGEAFVKEYDKLLNITGKNNIVHITNLAGIDIHSIDFWRASLKLIEQDIEKFISLI